MYHRDMTAPVYSTAEMVLERLRDALKVYLARHPVVVSLAELYRPL
jgi:hypothetical protein